MGFDFKARMVGVVHGGPAGRTSIGGDATHVIPIEWIFNDIEGELGSQVSICRVIMA